MNTKITIDDIARELARIDGRDYSNDAWGSLRYHRQLTYIVEAKRLVEAFKAVWRRKGGAR